MMFSPARMIAALALLWLGAGSTVAQSGRQPVDFNREIKPILSNTCFRCHGPDPDERKGGTDGLRLDTPEGAVEDLGGYAALVPGDVEKSALVKRINSTDPDEVMPPPSLGKPLTRAEIDLVTRWVREGGKYARHWSYLKPSRPEPPAVKDIAWPQNPIDRFLLARLEREGVKPQPEADRATLIRRASLDLTGLPPTLAEVDQFEADQAPGAYERLVDRLLAKQAYGEHWAKMWLDLARYADSTGYADDPPRTIWLFRDYVIRSLNANKPLDQFTLEQIAGDLLDKPTEEQLIATAFHRNTLTNNEGGTNDEEFRNVAIVDRVNTTMAVWMGTTIACAQCHSHKYDPISQEDYFRMFAIFNNTEDADKRDEAPLLSIFTPQELAQRKEWETEIAALEKTLTTQTPELAAAQAQWEQSLPPRAEWQTLKPLAVKTSSGGETTIDDDGSVRAAKPQKNETYTIELNLSGIATQAIRIEALADDKLPGKGPGHSMGNFIISNVSAKLAAAEVADAGKPLEFAAAVADYSQSGFAAEQVLNNKDPKQKGWAIGGQTGVNHALTLVLKSPLDELGGGKLTLTIEHSAQLANHVLGRFRLSATDSAGASEWGQIPAPVAEILQTPADKRTPAQQASLQAHYLTIAPQLAATRTKLAAVQKQLADSKPATVPIMRELETSKRRVTKIQHRGNYLDLGKEVAPGLPGALYPLPDGVKADRLALARWLMDDNNPLTARVLANRYWEEVFGIGIVSSSEEFGSQGDLPFHPELLDWLATELQRLKWDAKALVKLLVTSAAYRQSSRVSPELQQRDPDNRLLARGPRVRLSAEMVRDQALAVSGLLSERMYGASVKPPQPSIGLSAAFGGGIDWTTSGGEDRYRRGLYTSWRRSNPYPSMATFDAPNREVCTVRRVRTNTPLQALVMLNDPVYLEAAQALARRIVAAGGSSPSERGRYGFRLCTSRVPHDEELARLVQLYDQVVVKFKDKPDDAKKLASEPLGPVPAGTDVAELAAWTVVGNVLLNLDEMLMKR